MDEWATLNTVQVSKCHSCVTELPPPKKPLFLLSPLPCLFYCSTQVFAFFS